MNNLPGTYKAALTYFELTLNLPETYHASTKKSLVSGDCELLRSLVDFDYWFPSRHATAYLDDQS